MIRLNHHTVELNRFPDGTARLSLAGINTIAAQEEIPTITWCYDGDTELFALAAIKDKLDSMGAPGVKLVMPYIPNARMDRIHGGDVFTLKTFTKLLNGMHFAKIVTYEAHSNVSLALIDNIENHDCAKIVERILVSMKQKYKDDTVLFFPDEGACKRYSGLFETPYLFGMKQRDWKSGEILGLDIIGDEELIQGRTILIIDDICSKGGTFYFSAKRLRELGAKNVSLYVTHCENTILSGDVIQTDLLDDIYTTDSIFTDFENPLSQHITIVKEFRKGE